MYLGSGQMPSSSGLAMELPQVDNTREHSTKKRKASQQEGSDDDTGDDKSVRTDDNRKQNHSEIEKRRRDKMNTYITELSAMVPMCHAMSRKLDKLTVLRMAVQHLKTIRGAVHSYSEANYKPPFLTDLQLKQLILQAAEGFLFVVGCDRGRILYVSESVSEALNYSQGDLLGQSWFDILHPKDVAKVKEQLSSPDLNTRERLIDAKTMLPVKSDIPQGVSRLCPGARRSFFCRMKCKITTPIKEEADTTTGCNRRKKQHNSERKYKVIQCTGYLKSWAAAKIGVEEQESEGEGDPCSLSCLVAVGRLQSAPLSAHLQPHSPHLRPLQFISRHTVDGKFLFVDQRATLVLGFLPQELLGTSMYEYYNQDDIGHLADSHKSALQSLEPVTTQVYKFRSKYGNYVQVQSEWKSFKNPWTKEVEYLVAKNSRVLSNDYSADSAVQVESSGVRSESTTQSQNSFDFFTHPTTNGGVSTRDIPRLISSHLEASNIGRQIADEVIDEQKRCVESPASTPSPSQNEHNSELQLSRSILHDKVLMTGSPHKGNQKSMNNNGDSNATINNKVTLSSIGTCEGGEGEEMMEMMSGVSPQETVPSDGNDEAAMAVIMSLLEADAGLGGPVDFTGLPWPLP